MSTTGSGMKYRTIVADPPWDHSDGTGKSLASGGRLNYGEDWSGLTAPTRVPYPVMSLGEIAELPVPELAQADAHLYLWTTNRYLRDAYDVCSQWGFRVTKPLVWAKSPKGFMGGPFTSSCEFVLVARRGSLANIGRAGRQWWTWPRSGHSVKPEAFLDLVETVSPGPYLELFARRQRLGWDTWGDQALEHVSLSAPEAKGVYGDWCQDPQLCSPLGYCPRYPCCDD